MNHVVEVVQAGRVIDVHPYLFVDQQLAEQYAALLRTDRERINTELRAEAGSANRWRSMITDDDSSNDRIAPYEPIQLDYSYQVVAAEASKYPADESEFRTIRTAAELPRVMHGVEEQQELGMPPPRARVRP